MTSTGDPEALAEDSGLFSPVRAGSPVEAATGDRAFLQALLDAEAALARVQDTAAGRTVTAVARAERFDARSIALRARAGGNPVIPLVADLRAAVAERDPAHAEFVHRGATSQDIVDTALMLLSARAVDLTAADLERTGRALGALAAAHRSTPMAGRTLTQHAVPTTFGLKAAGWRELVLDALVRLARVRDALPAQLGGAAGTLAAFGGTGPATVSAYAGELGLAEPLLPWHVLRTPVADLGAALAFGAGALGKLAADVLVLSRTEVGELAEGTGGGSSAMPHKSNPVRATLIAAAARQVPAIAAILLGSLAAEDERPAGAWHAEWQPLREALRLVGGAAAAAAALCEDLEVRTDRMRRNLAATRGLVLTERAVEVLAPQTGRAAARRAVTDAARRAAERGTDLVTALAEDPALPALPELAALSDASAHLGSAPVLVDRALARGLARGTVPVLGAVRRPERGASGPAGGAPHPEQGGPGRPDDGDEPGRGTGERRRGAGASGPGRGEHGGAGAGPADGEPLPYDGRATTADDGAPRPDDGGRRETA
ncbi:3-carboxy-cis,cis-muconate cycloisomerase [Streptomyces wuyuanensis]|uniref:3-carboxy-cis,cis-muconate cycloisomerase n=1 Tax=Streptomyces wuyuanensis TaxID=1196353 RepID=A0A1G9S182_9ACTN|nr:3-carboxy-cis,cis-muconate cycloisomerase [Streptomyces wuyuanensis]